MHKQQPINEMYREGPTHNKGHMKRSSVARPWESGTVQFLTPSLTNY